MAAATGVRVTRHLLDVTDRAAVAAFPGAVTEEHAGIDLLINNAGVALAGTFEEVSEETSNGCSGSTSGAWCA